MSDFRGTVPLRIGFVMLHTSPLDVPGTKDAGGMNVVVRAQAEAVAAAGHAVRIFTRRSDPSLAPRMLLRSGVEVVHLDAGPPRLLAKSEHEGVMVEFGERLIAELRRDPVDLLHAEHWFSGIAALPAARELGLPLVQSYHSIAVAPDSGRAGEAPESPGRLAGERRLAASADLLVAVSQAEQDTIVADLGAAPERVCVVPLGVDTELFRPCERGECSDRQEWWEQGGPAELIAVGRLHPLKGFDVLLDALANIPAKHRPTLRIVGSPPPDGDAYARALHDQAGRLGVLGNTAFDGALRRAELAERIRRAALLLVPSHSETFGLVALEAAASGVPVVARRVGGLREAVVDGETGVLIGGGDPAEWAAVVQDLLGDPERLARMGMAARAHALTRGWGASVSALLAAYQGVLDRHAGGQEPLGGYRETSVVSKE